MFCCEGMRALVLGGLLLLGLGLLITCGGEAPPVEPGPPDQTYSLRGKVVSLPDERQKEISIYHEAISEFVGADGEVIGMDGMTMPFTVAEGETLEGVEKGDKVAFELEVRWDGDDVVTVRGVEKLPAETQLDFEKPTAPEADGSDTETADGEPASTENPDHDAVDSHTSHEPGTDAEGS